MGAVPTVDDLTVDWVRVHLGVAHATSVAIESVGTGQVANCYRLRIECDDATTCTFIAKTPSADETSRATASLQRLYEREVAFYQHLAANVETRTPACHFAQRDDADNFLLVLEDLSPSADVDQFTGITLDMARAGLRALAGLHGPTHARADLHDAQWLGALGESLRPLYSAVVPILFDQFLKRYAARIDEGTRQLVTALRDRIDQYGDYATPHRVVTHGDFRTDNLLIELDGEHMAVVDWQTIGVASPMLDVAYFLSTSLGPDDCARHDEELLAYYVDQLARFDVEYDPSLARREYARYTLQPIVMLVCASVIVEQTERGDLMFLEMIRRGVQAATRWRALEEVERHAAAQ